MSQPRQPTPSPLIRKLEHGSPLSPADRLLIEKLSEHIAEIPPHRDLIRQGETPKYVHVVLEGFACRYKDLPGGERQIVAWLVPGDFCDLHVSVIGEMDHAIATMTASRICHLPRDHIEAALEHRPQLLRAFWWATLVDEAVLREWLVNIGRRPADRRIAHLFCELLARLQAVGMAGGGIIDFPLTQIDLADTVGLSAVHVNRIIQQLREDGLIVWRGGKLRILNPAGLAAFSGFEPAYLHLRADRNPSDRAA